MIRMLQSFTNTIALKTLLMTFNWEVRPLRGLKWQTARQIDHFSQDSVFFCTHRDSKLFFHWVTKSKFYGYFVQYRGKFCLLQRFLDCFELHKNVSICTLYRFKIKTRFIDRLTNSRSNNFSIGFRYGTYLRYGGYYHICFSIVQHQCNNSWPWQEPTMTKAFNGFSSFL